MNHAIKFQSLEALHAYARGRKKNIAHRLDRVICARIIKILGYQHLYTSGPLLIGATAFDSVAKQDELPSLMQLIPLAATLNMYVELRLIEARFSKSPPSVRFSTEPGHNRHELIDFMEKNGRPPLPGSAREELRHFQQEHLHRMKNLGIRIHWTSLIGFFAASGYRLEVWFIDATEPSQVRLPERLKHCRKSG